MRLLFTLGNLTAKNNEARQQLFRCEASVDALLRLYDDYQLREEEPPPPPPPLASRREAEDVLVKLVRVLANMCIHEDVGAALASNTTCVQLLMETLGEKSEVVSMFESTSHCYCACARTCCHRAEVGGGERGAHGERGSRHQQPNVLPQGKRGAQTQPAGHRPV